MLHFGSEEGIEDTMTYLTVMETVKVYVWVTSHFPLLIVL